jgi:hypothetical protein
MKWRKCENWCFILTWIHTRKPVSSYNIYTLIVVKTNLFLQLLIIKRLNTGCVTRVTRMVSHVEQDFNLFTLLELMSSPTVFSGVYLDRSLVFSVVFCRSLFVPFLLLIVLSVSINYSFWLPLWYLQTFIRQWKFDVWGKHGLNQHRIIYIR